MLKNILLVFVGGGVGSALRYVCSCIGDKICPNFVFPVSTFFVNIVGCFLIGLLVGITARGGMLDEKMRLILVTGFCGGFTTFSTFAAENFKMLENGNYLLLGLYIAGSIAGGLLAVWGGKCCVYLK
ncbi:MAG: fluoride efflux transporter CrcB [Bacteroidales bacterium]|nr:fluoride efflux transporter CrcB [Bacteroidales bacterium]